MIGRRATVGLSLLCALMFCALAAQSASAQVGVKAVNTTAVTCVKGGGNRDFKDAHCDERVFPETGEFGHVLIANDTTTELDVTNEGELKLNGVIGGVNAEIDCKKVVSVPGKSFLHNVETESKHTVTGTVQLTLSECIVTKPINCIVTDIVLTATFEGVEGLNPSAKNEMGLEFVGEGEGGTLAEIIFHNKEPNKCGLDNKTKPFILKGSMIATGKTPTQKEKHSGATWVFETGPEANRMETLEIGLKPIQLTGVLTPRMSGGGNPIALTTTT